MTTAQDTVDADLQDGRCADARGECSLRAALQQAGASGGEHRVVLAGRTYRLTRAGAVENAGATGDLDVHSTVEVIGNGSTIDANHLDRAFDAYAGLTLRNLRVVNGRAPNVPGGPPTSMETAGETAVTESGGAIRGYGIELTDVVVRNSRAVGSFAAGGGVSAWGTVVMRRVRLVGNSAPRAGGALALYEPSEAILEDVEVRRNHALGGSAQDPGDGGGMYLYGHGSAQLSRIQLVRNTAAGHGGGLAALGGLGLDISDARIARNRAGVDGGGVHSSGGDVWLRGSQVVRNRAEHEGGGVWGAVQLVDTRVARNSAPVGPDVYP